MALKHPSGFVQSQAPSGAIKQLRPENILQLPQAPRDSWLCDVEPVCRNRNAFGARDFKKTTHVSQPEMSIPIHKQNGISLANNINIRKQKL